MGAFGLTLDVSEMPVLAWGDGVAPVEVDYQTSLTLGAMVRGEEYAIGPEGGVSYVYSDKDERGHHIFAWNAGLRGDFLKMIRKESFYDPRVLIPTELWGLRLAVGYKGELYLDDSVEHGLYASFMIQYAWQNRFPHELVDNPELLEQVAFHTSIYRNTTDEVVVRQRSRSPSECPIGEDSCEVVHLYEYEPETSFIIGTGPYFAYFPNSERGEVGLSLFIGADPFII